MEAFLTLDSDIGHLLRRGAIEVEAQRKRGQGHVRERAPDTGVRGVRGSVHLRC